MGFISNLKMLLRKCDSFKTNALLRYREEPEFQSVTGGLVSVMVVIAFTGIFTQTILNTIAKDYITASRKLEQQNEPSYFSTEKTPFLFAVAINGINMNDGIRYADVVMSQRYVVNKTLTIKSIPLVPCVKQNWAAISDQIGATFDRLNLQQWLCAPTNTTFNFQGKYTSDIFSYVKINVQPCNPALSTRPCADATTINNYIQYNQSFNFNYYHVNTLLNEHDASYLNYYLEDRTYFTYTMAQGTTANIYISAFKVSTDQSLFPNSDILEEKGAMVYEPKQLFYFQPTTSYAQLYIRKSSVSLNIERSFRKLDQTLAYIGGLFGVLMSLVFIFSIYNEYCFQVQMGSRLYNYDKNTPLNGQNYNILIFIASFFYKILTTIGFKIKSQFMQRMQKSKQEMKRQLDVNLLIRKINFLEDCMNFLFEQYQLKGLHLRGKQTLAQAIKNRSNYRIYPKTIKFISQSQKMKPPNPEPVNKDTQSNPKLGDTVELQANNLTFIPNEDRKNSEDMHLQETQNSMVLHQIEESEDFSDCQEEDIEIDTEFIVNSFQNLLILKKKAEQGNKRSSKIFQNVDPKIKSTFGDNENKSVQQLLATIKKKTSHQQTEMSMIEFQALDGNYKQLIDSNMLNTKTVSVRRRRNQQKKQSNDFS